MGGWRTSVFNVVVFCGCLSLPLMAGPGNECECFEPWQGGIGDPGCNNYCEYDGGTSPCGSNPADCGFECFSVTSITRQCFSSGTYQWVYPGSTLCDSCRFQRCAGGSALGAPMIIDAPPGTTFSGIGAPCDGIG